MKPIYPSQVRGIVECEHRDGTLLRDEWAGVVHRIFVHLTNPFLPLPQLHHAVDEAFLLEDDEDPPEIKPGWVRGRAYVALHPVLLGN